MKENINNEKTSEYWSKKNKYSPNWYSFCASYINELITDEPYLFPTQWVWKEFFKLSIVENALEIGCLQGKKLRGLVEKKMVLKGSGIDIARGAIAEAKKYAKEKGFEDRLHFSVMDLNKPSLAPTSYNWIISNGVLHHILELEVCINNIYDSLRPGGYLSASEFTGPSRYNYSKKEVELINEAKSMLPVELGGNIDFSPVQLEPKLDADPSESIRSEDIEEILNKTFDKLIIKPYGGNILMRGLGKEFFNNIDVQNQIHRQVYLKMIDFEKKLLNEGIRSHHTYFVAQKSD